MKNRRLSLLVWSLASVVVAAILAGPIFGEENKGSERIVVRAGHKGDVSFSHWAHQNDLKDCNLCHALFPETAGAIDTLKQEGKLSDKQVMKDLCLECHKKQAKNGEKAGPVSCKECHKS